VLYNCVVLVANTDPNSQTERPNRLFWRDALDQDKINNLKQQIVSEAEAALILGCSRRTLARERLKGSLSFRRIGGQRGRVLYSRQSILRFVEGQNA
jgi:Helix-turn-helix domain